jgi:hypothetical protein
MQIECARYGCQKSVEVCYWVCKFRAKCKDWRDALTGKPGIDAIRERLEGAAKRTGRVYDPQSLVVLTGRRAKS